MLDAQGNEVAEVAASVEVQQAAPAVETAVVPDVVDSPVVAPAPIEPVPTLTRAEVVEAWIETHTMAAFSDMAKIHPVVYLKAKIEELVKALEGL